MNKKDYLKIISKSLHSKEKKTFFYLNTHSFYLIKTNKDFQRSFNLADYITPDGFSIKWAVSLLHNKKIEKVSFNHIFFQDILKMFSENKANVYLLGSQSNSVSIASNNLKNYEPKINVAGFHHGYFDHDKESESIIKEINSVKPDILLVGIGMPDSVTWIIKNRESINTKLIFTVGNLFDIIAGKKKIAPKFLYNSPFEWIYKLLQEPTKLFPRYAVAHPYFIYYVLKEKFLGQRVNEL